MLQLPDTLHAVHAGQIDVHQHDIRTNLGQILQCILGIGILAQTAKAIRRLSTRAKGRTQLVVVFDDGNGDGHGSMQNDE